MIGFYSSSVASAVECLPGSPDRNHQIVFDAFARHDHELLSKCLSTANFPPLRMTGFLTHAINAGDQMATKVIIQAGALVNGTTGSDDYPLWRASYFSDDGRSSSMNAYAILDLLLANGADPHFVNRSGSTVLHAAASACNPTLVQKWLNMGLDPNSRDYYDHTPLIEAASGCYRSGYHMFSDDELDLRTTQITKDLLASGASPDARDKEGSTALSFFARDGRIEALRNLLDHGANANFVDSIGCSPLNYTMMFSAACDRRRAVQDLLLSHGARPSTNCILKFERLRFWSCVGT
jgi:hypothetical protein